MNNNNPRPHMSAQSPDTYPDVVRTGVQTDNAQWFTVEEAYEYLFARGISRTPKTIRRRCFNGGFNQTRKQDTQNGYRYQITKDSLDLYIKEEESPTQINHMHVDTSGQRFGHTSGQGEDMSGQQEEVVEGKGETQELRDKVKQLEADQIKKDEEIGELHFKLRNMEIEKKVAYQTRDYVEQMADRVYNDLKCKGDEYALRTNNLHHELGEARAKLEVLEGTQSLNLPEGRG